MNQISTRLFVTSATLITATNSTTSFQNRVPWANRFAHRLIVPDFNLWSTARATLVCALPFSAACVEHQICLSRRADIWRLPAACGAGSCSHVSCRPAQEPTRLHYGAHLGPTPADYVGGYGTRLRPSRGFDANVVRSTAADRSDDSDRRRRSRSAGAAEGFHRLARKDGLEAREERRVGCRGG